MTYVSEQTSEELRAHMKRLKAMSGWHEPLADRLYKEILALDDQIQALINEGGKGEGVACKPAVWRMRYPKEIPALERIGLPTWLDNEEKVHHFVKCGATAIPHYAAPQPSKGEGVVDEPIYQWRGSSADAWRDCPKVQYEYVGQGIAGAKPGTYGASWQRRIVYAAQSAPLTNEGGSEPDLIQYRMRPTWEPDGRGWTRWEDCSEAAAQDYERTPILHDWQYEVRRLYAQPMAINEGGKCQTCKGFDHFCSVCSGTGANRINECSKGEPGVDRSVEGICPHCDGSGIEEGGKGEGVAVGWKLIAVNEAFDALMNAMTRADDKGYLPDALRDEWAAFDYNAAPQPSKGEELVRYCPECGYLGDDMRPTAFTCCPDGSRARRIPKQMAELCHATFERALAQPSAQAPNNGDEK